MDAGKWIRLMATGDLQSDFVLLPASCVDLIINLNVHLKKAKKEKNENLFCLLLGYLNSLHNEWSH